RKAAVVRRAVTSARRMQQAIAAHGQVPTPIGTVTLKMKVGLTYGPVKRFNLGLPQYGFEDVLAGLTLDRMAEAEHHAEPGDIVADAATLALLPPNTLTVAGRRGPFAVVGNLLRPARPHRWPPLHWPPDSEVSPETLLTPYVPPQIAQTLAARRAQVAELKPVVSLFVQFHGIDYDTDPEVGRNLQTYFATAQKIIARYGGRLNRLITGDKGSLIHVIFGAPRTVEEQETRAVRCALDLQAECGGLPFISMQRIGVTVGRVFAGPVGSPNRHDYTTMGDSINLSARLMQNAADNQILMEEAVRAQLSPAVTVADLGTITVKGKSAPISVFAPLGVGAQAGRAGRKSDRIPLFGRDAEMETLRRRLNRLDRGEGALVTLVGEVGLGKTHMLAALRPNVSRATGWAEGMCLAYGQSLSGYLFIDLLRDLMALPPGSGPADSSRHLADFCRQLFGPARLDSTYPYLARFMGLPLADDDARRIESLAGESVRWQLFELFGELLRLLLQQRPLVLALDDLQWADPTSIQLLESLLPLAQTLPLLLILSMRPEHESKAWALREQIHAAAPPTGRALDITLKTLDRAPASALIAHYAPGLPQRLVDYLVEKGGGNPLFLVEIIHTMQAQGYLSGRVNLDAITVDALDLPNSVQGLLLAQIDRLTVEARHTLQMASVIGKTFLYNVLEALAAGEQDLNRQLSTLQAGEYILPDDPTDLGLAFAFRHILIQESAYSTLLYERRRAYHRRVARAIERLFPAQIGQQAGLLSHHYEQAEDLDTAIYYTLQAADQARLLYANEEAEMLYRRVLLLSDCYEASGVEPSMERRAKTYLKIAQVRANALNFEGAQEYYELAFELLEQVKQTAPPLAPVSQPPRPMRLAVLEQGPTTLDPGLAEVTDVSEIVNDLFEGLVELDTELNVIPAAARRWQIDDGGLRYRFELRPNLRWSDGAPLTARDFVFAWRRNLSPATGAGLAHQLYLIEGAEEFHRGQSSDLASIGITAVNDLTLEITLKTPAGYFPYLLAAPITYPQPAHAAPPNGPRPPRPTGIICNGPFKIAAWDEGREIRLEKNPFYRGLATGNLTAVSLAFVPPSFEQYAANAIDWCRVDDRADLPARFPKAASLAQYLQTFFIGFSGSAPPFNNRLVRQAFAHTIDRAGLVQSVWAGVQRPAMGGVVPPGMPGHSPEVGLRFDPPAARQLLEQAGYPSGAAMPELMLAAFPGLSTTPAYLSQTWREQLGVTVRPVEVTTIDGIVAGLNDGSIHMALLAWSAEYPDPDSILRVVFHSASPMNCFGWRNGHFDALVEQAARQTDQQTRLALYHRADRLLVAHEAAIAPLYYRQAYALMRPGFKLEGSGKIIRGGMFRLKHVWAG
ncbi:MAG: ABC transporter substrate-binding protein, partial [Anaerolineae bacterium]